MSDILATSNNAGIETSKDIINDKIYIGTDELTITSQSWSLSGSSWGYKFSKLNCVDTFPDGIRIGNGQMQNFNGAKDIYITHANESKKVFMSLGSQSFRGCEAEKIGFGGTVNKGSEMTVDLWFYQCNYLKEIYGEPLDWTYAAPATPNAPFNAPLLEEVRFVPNCLHINFPIGQCPNLSNGSIISIANALNETDPHKVTYHTTVKAKLSTILGKVELDSTQTFHIFTEDTSGTVTLQDFITITKGWTI